MEYVIAHWSADFAVGLISQFVALLGAGFALGGLVWITGYVLHHLLKWLKGGV